MMTHRHGMAKQATNEITRLVRERPFCAARTLTPSWAVLVDALASAYQALDSLHAPTCRWTRSPLSYLLAPTT